MAPNAHRHSILRAFAGFPGRLVAPCMFAIALLVAAMWTAPPATAQRAPAIAVAEFDIPLLSTPDPQGEVLADLPAGYEMQLTGSASGDYVEVATDGATGWVDVSTIHAGQVTTGITTALTQITDAPSDEGQLLTIVPEGETVILTGATADDYLAGAYEGTGGWLPTANIDR